MPLEFTESPFTSKLELSLSNNKGIDNEFLFLSCDNLYRS